MWLGWIGYGVVALLGYLVGWVELAQRYSDAPMRILRWRAAWPYLATNVAASMLGLLVLRTFDWTFGQAGAARELVQILVAGAGAMALFRSKLFTASQSTSHDIVRWVWSPATLMEGILRITDDQARREQARERIRTTAQMKALSWAQAEKLVPMVLAVMGASGETQNALAKDFNSLRKNPEGFSDEERVRLLGLAILEFAGPVVLLDVIKDVTSIG